MRFLAILLILLTLFVTAPMAFCVEETVRKSFVEQADEAILDGKYSDAALLLRKAIDREPEDWGPRLKLIGLLVQVSGKEAEASKEISLVLRMDKVELEHLVKIAEVCVEFDFPDEAVKLYQKIIKQEGPDAALQRKMINLLIETGKVDSANREINRYIKDGDFSREELIELGNFCEERLRYKTAAHVYEKIVEKHPDFVQAKLRLAKNHARNGNLDEAKKVVEEIIASEPKNADARAFLAALLFDSGKYQEALDVFEEILKTSPNHVEALAGKAETLFMKGRYEESEAAYKLAVDVETPSAKHLKKFADLYKYTGRYDEANTLYLKAIKADASSTDAITGLGESYSLRGKFDEAEKEFLKLYDFWDEVEDPKELSATDLTNIGVACQNNDNPEDALTCYTMAQEKEPRYLPAKIALGKLFLERHQAYDASNEFKKLLILNPNEPDALAGMAIVYLMRGRYELVEENCNKALSVNPNHIDSLNVMASMYMLDKQWDKSLENINKALKTNPNSLDTQSYLAAYYYHTRNMEEFARTEKKVLAINPKYSEFYRVVSSISERQRRNEEAIALLKKAIALNPKHASSYAAIGRIIMRNGLGQDAQEYLDKAFELDPYNPRMANSINLLRYIKRDFATEETEHFIVRWDKKKDYVLQHFLPQYVEEIYPKVTGHFGYEPPVKTVFDMFPEHKWFSARISGMPFIATVGACFGSVFAMDSPRKSGFNWQKVLEHEFTHVVTLQQTNFNIPFWFTEGLAVEWEKGPAPIDWDRILVRMNVFDELIPLDDLDSWFTRPKNMDQKQWAYAQSELTVQYIYENWGKDAITKMLKLYAENKPTSEVIQECLGIPQSEFEQRVYKHCMSVASKIPLGPKFLVGDKKLLEGLMKDNPEIPAYQFNYARCLLQTINARMTSAQAKKAYDDARSCAKKAIELKSDSPIPHTILAFCDFQQKQYDDARKHIGDALKKDPSCFAAHYYLGKLNYMDKKYDKAIEHFEKARALFPKMTDIQQGLAAMYKEKNDEEKVIEYLEEIILYGKKPYNDAKQLLKLRIDRNEYDKALRLGEFCLRYNLYDPEVYKLAGDAAKGKKDDKLVEKYYSIGSDIAWRIGSKEVKKDRARKYLTLAVEMDPKNTGAKELLDKIGGPIKVKSLEVNEKSEEDLTKLRNEGAGEEENDEEELEED